jgi:hypothetical protein
MTMPAPRPGLIPPGEARLSVVWATRSVGGLGRPDGARPFVHDHIAVALDAHVVHVLGIPGSVLLAQSGRPSEA